MDLRERYDYPASTPALVYGMLTDQEFLEGVAAATGAREWQVTVHEVPGGGVRTRVHRVLPPMVPDFVRTFVGDQVDVIEEVTYHPTPSGHRGELDVRILRAPVRMRGGVALDFSDPGALHRIEGTIKASVPFIGGRIERAAGEAVRAAARKQHQVGVEWLRRHQSR